MSESVTTTATSFTVHATVGDTLSGIAWALCNGVGVTVTGTDVPCSATLAPGVNAVVISLVDAAGNSAARGLTVTRTGTPTSLRISPGITALLPGRRTVFQALDEFGTPVEADSWTSSDPSVATIDVVDDEPVLIAVSGGTTTVTAEWGTLNASAPVTVASGASFSMGTVLWGIPPSTGSWLSSFVAASPPDSSFYSYFVEDQNAGVVRGIAYDGREVASFPLPPNTSLKMAHVDGGFVVAGEGVLVRLAPPPGHRPWRYEFDRPLVQVLQGDNGSVYVVLDEYVDVVDGDDGHRILRETLPKFRGGTRNSDCFEGQNYISESVAMGSPVIDGADRFRLPLLVGEHVFDYFPCGIGSDSLDNTIKLLTISGSTATYSTMTSSTTVTLGPPTSLVPNGDEAGDIRLAWDDGDHVGGGASVSDSSISLFSPAPPFGRTIVGEHDIAYTGTGDDLRAWNVVSGATLWTSSQWMRPLAALAEGGVAAVGDDGTLYHVDESGSASAVGTLLLEQAVLGQGGSWVGLASGALVSVAGTGAMTNFEFLTGDADAAGNQKETRPEDRDLSRPAVLHPLEGCGRGIGAHVRVWWHELEERSDGRRGRCDCVVERRECDVGTGYEIHPSPGRQRPTHHVLPRPAPVVAQQQPHGWTDQLVARQHDRSDHLCKHHVQYRYDRAEQQNRLSEGGAARARPRARPRRR
jgi:hypothetical protein